MMKITKTVRITDPVLHLPIMDSDRMYYIKIAGTDGRVRGEFYIGLTPTEPDFWCPLYMYGYEGQDVIFSTEDEDAPEDLFDGILVGGKMEDRPDLYPDLYAEPTRPQVHFSSRRGWLNDPNGLVWAGGAFHMCYQHNPYGPHHGGVNVSWGLAVSEDGVHFREYPDAVQPRDPLTHIASGSAIVDRDDVLGMGPDTVIAVYTALESAMFKGKSSVGTRGQMLEYSTDGGFTFRPIEEDPIIPVPSGQYWRDPKILSMEDGSLCIAVYETDNGKNCVSFYSSRDGRTWQFRSRTTDLYECPDLFPLPVSETGETVWCLYGANGEVRFGDFRDYAFIGYGESHPLDCGSATYAGQTWNSHPDKDCRYHIAWFRDEKQNWSFDPAHPERLPFSQSMTLLCRFTLHRVNGSLRLFRAPIEAFSSLRRGEGRSFRISGKYGAETLRLERPGDCELCLSAQDPFRMTVDGAGFSFDPADGMLRFTSGKSCARLSDGEMKVRIVTDVHSAEFFIDGGISATFFSPSPEKKLVLEGGEAEGRAWLLDSIWTKKEQPAG